MQSVGRLSQQPLNPPGESIPPLLLSTMFSTTYPALYLRSPHFTATSHGLYVPPRSVPLPYSTHPALGKFNFSSIYSIITISFANFIGMGLESDHGRELQGAVPSLFIPVHLPR